MFIALLKGTVSVAAVTLHPQSNNLPTCSDGSSSGFFRIPNGSSGGFNISSHRGMLIRDCIRGVDSFVTLDFVIFYI